MRSLFFRLALSLWLVGCVGVPQPEPPSLDPNGVVGVPGGRNTTYGFALAPGAVDPARGDLWVVGLEDPDDPQLLPVQDDGSVALFEVASERVRMQVRDGDARGIPVDFEHMEDGARVAPRLLECLVVPLEVDLGDAAVASSVEATFLVQNDCADDVALTASLRRASDVALVDAPTTVPAGTRATVRMRLSPTAEGLREEVLLVEHRTPESGLRAVTLFGRGLP